MSSLMFAPLASLYRTAPHRAERIGDDDRPGATQGGHWVKTKMVSESEIRKQCETIVMTPFVSIVYYVSACVRSCTHGCIVSIERDLEIVHWTYNLI